MHDRWLSERSATTANEPAPSRARHLFILIAAALSVAATSCQTPTIRDRLAVTKTQWTQEGFAGRQLQTARCKIVSTMHDAELEDALPLFVEQLLDRFESLLPVDDRTATPLTVYIFAARTQWLRFTQRRYPDHSAMYAQIRRGGYTQGAVSALFYTDRGATLATVAHELWHQYVNTRIDGDLPAWINEGMACYVEALRFDGKHIVHTPTHNVFRANSLCEAVQGDRLLTLPDLLGTDPVDAINHGDTRAAQTYYAQAWALVTWLRHGDGGSHAGAFNRMLKDIADGAFRIRVSAEQLTASSEANRSFGRSALQTYFGGSAESMQQAYDEFLLRTCRF